jgi:2-polyprenyl-6-methoxyphenol hydroxylase-like FAD-dependent oxidoreductase
MIASGGNAIVLGASMAGLLAARVLADFYQSVIVVERDVLPYGMANRRGVPQGRHPHVLMARAPQILEELFPGCMHELVESGCVAWRDGDLSKLHLAFRGHRLAGAGTIPQPSELVNYARTRAFLDWHVRRRVRDIRNVAMLDGHDATELIAAPDRSRITGVRVIDRSDGSEAVLAAGLVVDASGRGSRTPLFLDDLGYGRPAEDEVFIQLTYASMPVHIALGACTRTTSQSCPSPAIQRVWSCSNARMAPGWSAYAGCVRQAVPNHRDELLEFAASLAPAAALSAACKATPLAEVSRHHMPSNRWRRYDKMSRTPDGSVVLGDAVCSFNPVYGQGVTVAAVESLVLRDCLARGEEGLPRRFFKQSAETIRIAWQTAVGSDLTMPQAKGPHHAAGERSTAANGSIDQRLDGSYIGRRRNRPGRGSAVPSGHRNDQTALAVVAPVVRLSCRPGATPQTEVLRDGGGSHLRMTESCE